MAIPRTIRVGARGELADLLELATKGPVVLEKGGERYRVTRVTADDEEDIWANYDPEKAREAVLEYAGSWSDIDLDAFKAAIYRAREEGTKPPKNP